MKEITPRSRQRQTDGEGRRDRWKAILSDTAKEELRERERDKVGRGIQAMGNLLAGSVVHGGMDANIDGSPAVKLSRKFVLQKTCSRMAGINPYSSRPR